MMKRWLLKLWGQAKGGDENAPRKKTQSTRKATKTSKAKKKVNRKKIQEAFAYARADVDAIKDATEAHTIHIAELTKEIENLKIAHNAVADRLTEQGSILEKHQSLHEQHTSTSLSHSEMHARHKQQFDEYRDQFQRALIRLAQVEARQQVHLPQPVPVSTPSIVAGSPQDNTAHEGQAPHAPSVSPPRVSATELSPLQNKAFLALAGMINSYDQEGIAFTELTRELYPDRNYESIRTSVSHILKALEGKGLIKRKKQGSNQQTFVFLTQQGRMQAKDAKAELVDSLVKKSIAKKKRKQDQ